MTMLATAVSTVMVASTALLHLGGVVLELCMLLVLASLWLVHSSKASPAPEPTETTPDLAVQKSADSRLLRLCSDKLLGRARQAGAQGCVEQAAPNGDSTIKAAWPRPAPTCQPDACAAAAAATPAPATPTAAAQPQRSCRYASADVELRVSDSAELWLSSSESLAALETEPELAPSVTTAPPTPAAAARRSVPFASPCSSVCTPPTTTTSCSPRKPTAGNSSSHAIFTAPKQLPKKAAASAPRSSSSSRAAPAAAPRKAAVPAAPTKACKPSGAPVPVAAAKQQRKQACQPATPGVAPPAAPTTPTTAPRPRRTCRYASADVELRVTDSAELWLSGTFAAEVPSADAAAEPWSPVDWRTNPLCSEALELRLGDEAECSWLAAQLDESFLVASYGGFARKYEWE